VSLGLFFGGVDIFWGEETRLLPKGEHAVGLYERLVQEAAELSEDPNRERNERISAYVRNQPLPRATFASLPMM